MPIRYIMKAQEVMINLLQPKNKNGVMEDQLKQAIGENAAESWINTTWRPMMAWQYFVVCLFDFVVGPIGWAIIQPRKQRSRLGFAKRRRSRGDWSNGCCGTVGKMGFAMVCVIC